MNEKRASKQITAIPKKNYSTNKSKLSKKHSANEALDNPCDAIVKANSTLANFEKENEISPEILLETVREEKKTKRRELKNKKFFGPFRTYESPN